uniref:Kelch repeat-containing protein n=1 Tax=Ruegeria sp. HKCCD8929 TaxID=2683006 RepID=UPI00148A07E8
IQRWKIPVRNGPKIGGKVTSTGDKKSPGWCFDRFGQSATHLPDGSVVYIGGEHEDHYDPDFYIYNDVVVVRSDASIEIYGYPTDVFPPTDFHSATLCGDEIIIVGGLRYHEHRDYSDTFVFRLRLTDFSIHRVETQGDAPSWLYEHKAELASDGKRLICTGGQVTHHPTEFTVENLTTWEFDLESKSWNPMATESGQRWMLLREDESWNDLWKIEQVACASRSSRQDTFAERYRAEFEERGHVVDPNLFYARFSPPVPHSVLEPDPDSEEYRVHRILVAGVVVRFVEDMHEIAVTVKGELSSELLEALKRHCLETYSGLEGVPYKSVHL